MQLRLHFDPDKRTVTLAMGSPLGGAPSVMEVPFAIWKAAAAEILRTESEDELAVKSAPVAPNAAEPKIITRI